MIWLNGEPVSLLRRIAYTPVERTIMEASNGSLPLDAYTVRLPNVPARLHLLVEKSSGLIMAYKWSRSGWVAQPVVEEQAELQRRKLS